MLGLIMRFGRFRGIGDEKQHRSAASFDFKLDSHCIVFLRVFLYH